MINNLHDYPFNRPGMSLAELIIVLCITALLASIATLTFSGMTGRAQLQSAADRLISDLRLVRDQAQSDKKTYTLQIKPGLLSYEAPGVFDINNERDISVNLGDSYYRINAMIIQLDNGSSISFDKRGKPSSVGNIILRRGLDKITIVINKVGRIEQIDP
ncbi:MAG: hypothetical protein AMJ79_00110 [Phycisphaerae bacterium SM23_30]|nr:MAG: hypothetical protein AMJ79_00110 [Phycisphaerae bacterium SM23_30]